MSLKQSLKQVVSLYQNAYRDRWCDELLSDLRASAPGLGARLEIGSKIEQFAATREDEALKTPSGESVDDFAARLVNNLRVR